MRKLKVMLALMPNHFINSLMLNALIGEKIFATSAEFTEKLEISRAINQMKTHSPITVEVLSVFNGFLCKYRSTA